MPADPEPTARSHPARLLRQVDAAPKRRLSQSFLVQSNIAEAMVAAAELQASDTVVEIGPGLGILTEQLVAACHRVVAIEIDGNLARQLPAHVGTPSNLEIIAGDALTTDLAALVSPSYHVVASLPYHVATPILFRLLFEAPRPSRITVMLQQEVAQRLAAPPGARSYLSMAIGLVASPHIVQRVPPGAFFPTPRVWSAIVRLDMLPMPPIPPDEHTAFRSFLRAGFTQPRKQLANSLAQGLSRPAGRVRDAVRAAGIDSTRRPATLELGEWRDLFSLLSPT